jgi:protein-L-isoaspartate(D-aspartate) O-methyltransferase
MHATAQPISPFVKRLTRLEEGCEPRGLVISCWRATTGRIIFGNVRYKALAIVLWLASFLKPGASLTNVALAADKDPLAAARIRMVRDQLSGPGRAITNTRVLAAMRKVPRHQFVPERYRSQAYEDAPLPIGYGQTISQPYVVAFMTEQLDPKPTDRVLEIGTGSGYQAALLAELVAEVYTIEIIGPLAQRAETDLKRLGYKNVTVRAGDGYKGWPEAAPFDAIIVTCAPENVPQPLVEQLKDGGRMIIPVGPAGNQELVLLRKQGNRLEKRATLPVSFVPMTGEVQRKSEGRKPKPEGSPRSGISDFFAG